MARSVTWSTASPRSKRTSAARRARYAAPDGGSASIQPALARRCVRDGAAGATGTARVAVACRTASATADRSRSAGRSAARARLRAAALARQSGRAHRRLGSRSRRRHRPPPRRAANPVSSPPPAAPPRQRGSNRMPARRAPNPGAATSPTSTSLRAKMMKRVKSLFIAASIIAIVVGAVQIAGKLFDFGSSIAKLAEAPLQFRPWTPRKPSRRSTQRRPSSKRRAAIAAKPFAPPAPPAMGPLAPPALEGGAVATVPPLGMNQMPRGDAVIVRSAGVRSEGRRHRIDSASGRRRPSGPPDDAAGSAAGRPAAGRHRRTQAAQRGHGRRCRRRLRGGRALRRRARRAGQYGGSGALVRARGQQGPGRRRNSAMPACWKRAWA